MEVRVTLPSTDKLRLWGGFGGYLEDRHGEVGVGSSLQIMVCLGSKFVSRCPSYTLVHQHEPTKTPLEGKWCKPGPPDGRITDLSFVLLISLYNHQQRGTQKKHVCPHPFGSPSFLAHVVSVGFPDVS